MPGLSERAMERRHERGPVQMWVWKAREWMRNPRTQRAIELTAAGVLATWGVLLRLPYTTFNGAGYAALKAVGLTEEQWGVVFLGVALMMTGGLVFRRTHVRMLGLILATGLFAFIATMFLVSNIAGLGWAGNYGYAVLCLIALRRLVW